MKTDVVAPNQSAKRPPGRPPRFTEAEVADALRNNHGLVVRAAEHLGCSAWTVREYVRRYPSVARARDEGRSLLLDAAEKSLMDAVRRGEGWAVTLTLRTLGKERGYTERRDAPSTFDRPVEATIQVDQSR